MAEEVILVGVDAAQNDLARWVKQLGPQIETRSRQFAETLRGQVSSIEPVLTGRLAASVAVEAIPDGAGLSLGDDLDYAAWIEFGGSRGRPYIREGRTLYPTVAASQDEYVAALTDEVNKTISQFPWSKVPGGSA